jgi:UDP-GlcNAc3NAcA epimerase
MKIVSIVGARPQFIKAAPIGQELFRRGHENILIHTGQHYDFKLSKVFFDELNIPAPDYNLEVGANTPIVQMASMMKELVPIVVKEKPDCAIIYGDTNSTLAAAITLLKTLVPIAHVEGGERNFTQKMEIVHPASIPEESNRVLVDHISELIFCASKRAVSNLEREGITRQVFWVGDVMLDTFSLMRKMAETRSNIIKEMALSTGEYILATVHRAINTNNADRLREIIHGLCSCETPVIFPIHPRTQKVLGENGLDLEVTRNKNLRIIDAVGYFDMLELEKNARIIVTDSGGVTREAFFSGVPSIIVDDTTAWIDLVNSGWSCLTGADSQKISQAINSFTIPKIHEPLLGEANARTLIVDHLETWKTTL